MNTPHAHLVPTLPRVSWMFPWLTTVAISAAIVWVMTAMLVAGQSYTLAAESTRSTTPETFAIGKACDPADNWQLVYARTTGRLPASYCPAAR